MVSPLSVTIVASLILCEASSLVERPNVVIFLADDMGWGDLGANMDESLPSETPHMDELAAQGLRLTDLHAGSSVCTVSRAALLTGRTGVRTGVVVNFSQRALYGMSQQEITLPQLLKQASYDTFMVGKWHLGHAEGYLPHQRGFDSWIGIPYSWDMGCTDGVNGVEWFDNFCAADTYRLGCPTWWADPATRGGAQAGQPGVPLMQDAAIVAQPAELSELTEAFDNAAVDFLRAHAAVTATENEGKGVKREKATAVPDVVPEEDKQRKNKKKKEEEEEKGQESAVAAPFFLFYASPHMHAPQAFSAEFANASVAGTAYANALREMDNSVGVLSAALDSFGLAATTLFIVTSDNGPWNIKGDWRLGGLDCAAVPGAAPLPDPDTVGGLAGNQGPFQGLWQQRLSNASAAPPPTAAAATTTGDRSAFAAAGSGSVSGGGGGGGTGKFTPWEGGHRVPGIMSWRGVLGTSASMMPSSPPPQLRSALSKPSPPSSSSSSSSSSFAPYPSAAAGQQQVLSALLSHMDFFPTIASLAGVPLPTDRDFDGLDLGPILFNASTPDDSASGSASPDSSSSSSPSGAAARQARPSSPPSSFTFPPPPSSASQTLLPLTSLDDRASSSLSLAPPPLVNLSERVLLIPGPPPSYDDPLPLTTEAIFAARVGNSMKVHFRTYGAAACGELYSEFKNVGNDTLVFDLAQDPEESVALAPTASAATARAVALAFAALARLNETLRLASPTDHVQSATNFTNGPVPEAWACAGPENLSCRPSVAAAGGAGAAQGGAGAAS